MDKCWEKKGNDRPRFAELVPLLQTAVNRLCPDRSLIPQSQAEGDQQQINMVKADVPKQAQASSHQIEVPPSLSNPAITTTVVPSVSRLRIEHGSSKEQQGVCQ